MLFIFDMGGVVTTTFDMQVIFNKLNTTKEDFFNICNQHNDNIWDKLETGNISTVDFWKTFNSRVESLQRNLFDGFLKIGGKVKSSHEVQIQNIPKVEIDLFRLYFNPKIQEKTCELIKNLRKKHRVVCGTNTIQSHWENHTERGDYAFFDKTYASNKINCAKPNPHFFELILEAENYKPEETFFVDDKQNNIDAAKSLGINAELMTTPEELYKKWKKYL